MDTVCIAVDSESHLFLAGRGYTATHNTTIILAVMGQVSSTPGMGAPMLVLMPTLDNAEMLSKERFQPMIDASAHIKRGQISAAKKGEAGSTAMQKRFRNGTIINFVGSNAPAALASRPVKYLLADEIDRFSVSAGQEGSPLELGKKRTSTFRGNGRKILATSTPTLAGVSEIERHWNASDQRIFLTKCPHCDHEHELQFDNIEWDGRDEQGNGGDPSTARYPCPECGVCWSEEDRLKSIAAGRWEITRPWVKGHAGFRASALISPWVGQWDNAAKEFIDSRGKPELERVFVNTYLGLPFKSEDLAIDEEEIVNRMEAFGLDVIPEGVLAITGGADIQKDRIELLTLGHSETQSYILAHEIIWGDTTGVKVWNDLEEALSRNFQHALGNHIGYDAVAVDSGYLTTSVLDFAVANSYLGVYAIKGVSGERPMWEASKAKQKGERKLFLVGVDDAKTAIMERLKNGDREQHSYIHIADMGTYSQTFAMQLLSEYRDIKFQSGRPMTFWARKPGVRAEVLDCCVYAWAVRQTIKPNWETRRKNLTRVPEQEDEQEDSGWATF
jgi:phage terminase large subunit GpA-like protein